MEARMSTVCKRSRHPSQAAKEDRTGADDKLDPGEKTR